MNIIMSPIQAFRIGVDTTITCALEFLKEHFPDSFNSESEDCNMSEEFTNYIVESLIEKTTNDTRKD